MLHFTSFVFIRAYLRHPRLKSFWFRRQAGLYSLMQHSRDSLLHVQEFIARQKHLTEIDPRAQAGIGIALILRRLTVEERA